MEQYQSYSFVPTCKNYHPLSELSSLSGYYPNISPTQLSAVNELKLAIWNEKLRFHYDEEDEFLKLLRFLRARKFNVKNALAMAKDDVKWREEKNRLMIRKETAADVLNCDINEIYKFFPVWFQGFDKQQRPVSYRQFGKFEIWNVLKLTTMERLIRFHAWETEQALRTMYSLSNKSGYNIETFVLVIDAAGWNMSLATSDAFAFIKGMATTDSDHYPERLGTMLIINAPSVLSFAWRIIQGFLDNVTKAKIHILSSNPDEWRPVLQRYIDIDQIPMKYGGTARDLDASEAIDQMNPPRPILGTKIGDTVSSSTNIRKSSRTSTGHAASGSTTPVSYRDEACDSKTNVLSDNSIKLIDRGTQTDEGAFVMATEIHRLRSKTDCSIM
jgi:hypothetical protein